MARMPEGRKGNSGGSLINGESSPSRRTRAKLRGCENHRVRTAGDRAAIAEPVMCRLSRARDKRHSYASAALANGETVFAMGRLLGHRDLATTLRYTHLADAMVRDGIPTQVQHLPTARPCSPWAGCSDTATWPRRSGTPILPMPWYATQPRPSAQCCEAEPWSARGRD